MKTKIVIQVFLAGFMVLSSQAYAGDFTALPTGGSDIRVIGVNNRAVDSMYLTNGLSSNWVEIAMRDTPLIWSTKDSKNPDGATFTYGTFQDKVYRNSNDNTLLFGSRLSLNIDFSINNPDFTQPTAAFDHLFYSEANYIWRSGYNGFTTAVAWYPQLDPDSPFVVNFDMGDGTGNNEYNYGGDYALKAAAMTSQTFKTFRNSATANHSPAYNPDVVAFMTDVSSPEANPNSAWYFVKTNATDYTLLDNATRILQDGGNGEGRPTRNFFLSAFAPTVAVPEPETYALMLAGILMITFSARRRSA